MRRLLLALVLALVAVPAVGAAPLPFAQPSGPLALPSLARQRRAVERLVAAGLPVYCGGSSVDAVALTFDDGPGPYAGRIVRELRRAGARATFFLVGNRIGWWPDAPREEATVGAVEDHSWSHPPLTQLPRWDVWLELARTQRAVAAGAGAAPLLFRAPYELHDPLVDGLVRRLGLLQVLWDVRSADDALHPTVRSVVRNVVAGLRPGAIVLLHELHPWTVRALPRILRAIRARHLRTLTVPELLAVDPPPPACR